MFTEFSASADAGRDERLFGIIFTYKFSASAVLLCGTRVDMSCKQSSTDFHLLPVDHVGVKPSGVLAQF